MDIKKIIYDNNIIHIYSQHKDVFLNCLDKDEQCKYLYVTDYNTPYSININDFKLKTDIINIFTGNIIKHVGELDKSSFNSFIYNKIHFEKYNIIVYDFISIKSIYFIKNMFYNTRINKNKTILCFSYKLPPEFRENVDILVGV
jgi:hypothetical protein